MKQIVNCLVVVSVFFISSIQANAQDPNFHIYLMFGQSNMEGQGPIEAQDRVTNPRVKLLQDQTCSNLNRTYGTWYTAAPPLVRCWGRVGPGDSFGKTMAENTPSNITIGIVNTSVGGCDIALFQKGAPIGRQIAPGQGNADIPTQFDGGYAWMLDLAKKAQTAGVIKGILFHQGETNTNDQTWKNKVKGIVENLKADLGLGDIPFLAGELLYTNNGGPERGCCASHNTEINKLPELIPNAHIISASGLQGQDVAHFTTAAYRAFGIRYATKMLELVSTTTTCTPTPIEAYLQLNAGDWQQKAVINACIGNQITLGPHPIESSGWNWTGPNGFTATTREINLSNIATNQSGKYTVSYTNPDQCTSSIDYTIVVNTSTVLEPFMQINNGSWTAKSDAEVCEGATVNIGPHPYDIETGWSWTGPNNFTNTTREINLSDLLAGQSGNYIVSFTNSLGCTSSAIIPITVYKKPEIWISPTLNDPITTSPANFLIETAYNESDIDFVQFYSGNTFLGEDNQSPYSYLWENIADGSFDLTLHAVSQHECESISPVYNLVVSKVTNLNNSMVETQRLFYPNPVHNQLILNQVSDWELFDSLGKWLKKGGSRVIDLSDNPSGIYFLKIEEQLLKVIKN